MQPPCEIVVKRLLPKFRAEIVRVLVNTYGAKQVEVAKALGITQGSVSLYLNDNRGVNDELLEACPEVRRHAEQVVEDLREGKGTLEARSFCELCALIKGNTTLFPDCQGTLWAGGAKGDLEHVTAVLEDSSSQYVPNYCI